MALSSSAASIYPGIRRKPGRESRIDARYALELPVEIYFGNRTQEDRTILAKTTNIGPGGAFIKTPMALPLQSLIKLNTALEGKGSSSLNAKVVRQNKLGFALKFDALTETDRIKLWKLISKNLADSPYCPFCGNFTDRKSKRCKECGRSLAFNQAGAFDIYNQEVIARCFDLFDQMSAHFIHSLLTIELQFKNLASDINHLLKETLTAIKEISFYCSRVEALLAHNPELLLKKRKEFHKKTNFLLSKSHLVRWARIWPQGYPGDFRIIEDLYRNTQKSIGLGYLLDVNFLNNSLAQGVRGRKELIKDILLKELAERRQPSIINLGCGSCRELFEIAQELDSSGAMLTCLDLDADALDFAANRFSYTGLQSNLMLRRYNVIRMLSHEKNLKEFGYQDIIYTLGVFDYIKDETLIRLIKSLYDLLKPQGKFICAFPDCETYAIEEFNWIVDWPLIHRTKFESRALLKNAGIPDQSVEIRRDRSGVILFYIVTKE